MQLSCIVAAISAQRLVAHAELESWSGVAPLYSVSRIRHSMEEYQNKRRISIVPVAEATVRLVFSSCCLLLFSHPQI